MTVKRRKTKRRDKEGTARKEPETLLAIVRCSLLVNKSYSSLAMLDLHGYLLRTSQPEVLGAATPVAISMKTKLALRGQGRDSAVQPRLKKSLARKERS